MSRVSFVVMGGVIVVMATLGAFVAAPGVEPPKAMAIDSRGTLTGRFVVKDVDKDDLEARNKRQLEVMKSKDEFKPCHQNANAEELNDQGWVIGADNGLANVVVWLAPPADCYYKLTEDDLDPEKGRWQKEKVLDQPHCAFMPHVMTLFSFYKEGGKDKATGQTVTVKNSAVMDHNTKIEALGFNSLLGAGKNEKMPGVKPNSKPYQVNCNIHSWMSAYIWSFDHPFAAVTDKDGKFEIKNAPAGIELRLMCWHESMGDKPKEKKVTIEKGSSKDEGTLEVEYTK